MSDEEPTDADLLEEAEEDAAWFVQNRGDRQSVPSGVRRFTDVMNWLREAVDHGGDGSVEGPVLRARFIALQQQAIQAGLAKTTGARDSRPDASSSSRVLVSPMVDPPRQQPTIAQVLSQLAQQRNAEPLASQPANPPASEPVDPVIENYAYMFKRYFAKLRFWYDNLQEYKDEAEYKNFQQFLKLMPQDRFVQQFTQLSRHKEHNQLANDVRGFYNAVRGDEWMRRMEHVQRGTGPAVLPEGQPPTASVVNQGEGAPLLFASEPLGSKPSKSKGKGKAKPKPKPKPYSRPPKPAAVEAEAGNDAEVDPGVHVPPSRHVDRKSRMGQAWAAWESKIRWETRRLLVESGWMAKDQRDPKEWVERTHDVDWLRSMRSNRSGKFPNMKNLIQETQRRLNEAWRSYHHIQRNYIRRVIQIRSGRMTDENRRREEQRLQQVANHTADEIAQQFPDEAWLMTQDPDVNEQGITRENRWYIARTILRNTVTEFENLANNGHMHFRILDPVQRAYRDARWHDLIPRNEQGDPIESAHEALDSDWFQTNRYDRTGAFRKLPRLGHKRARSISSILNPDRQQQEREKKKNKGKEKKKTEEPVEVVHIDDGASSMGADDEAGGSRAGDEIPMESVEPEPYVLVYSPPSAPASPPHDPLPGIQEFEPVQEQVHAEPDSEVELFSPPSLHSSPAHAPHAILQATDHDADAISLDEEEEEWVPPQSQGVVDAVALDEEEFGTQMQQWLTPPAQEAALDEREIPRAVQAQLVTFTDPDDELERRKGKERMSMENDLAGYRQKQNDDWRLRKQEERKRWDREREAAVHDIIQHYDTASPEDRVAMEALLQEWGVHDIAQSLPHQARNRARQQAIVVDDDSDDDGRAVSSSSIAKPKPKPKPKPAPVPAPPSDDHDDHDDDNMPGPGGDGDDGDGEGGGGGGGAGGRSRAGVRGAPRGWGRSNDGGGLRQNPTQTDRYGDHRWSAATEHDDGGWHEHNANKLREVGRQQMIDQIDQHRDSLQNTPGAPAQFPPGFIEAVGRLAQLLHLQRQMQQQHKQATNDFDELDKSKSTTFTKDPEEQQLETETPGAAFIAHTPEPIQWARPIQDRPVRPIRAHWRAPPYDPYGRPLYSRDERALINTRAGAPAPPGPPDGGGGGHSPVYEGDAPLPPTNTAMVLRTPAPMQQRANDRPEVGPARRYWRPLDHNPYRRPLYTREQGALVAARGAPGGGGGGGDGGGTLENPGHTHNQHPRQQQPQLTQQSSHDPNVQRSIPNAEHSEPVPFAEYDFTQTTIITMSPDTPRATVQRNLIDPGRARSDVFKQIRANAVRGDLYRPCNQWRVKQH